MKKMSCWCRSHSFQSKRFAHEAGLCSWNVNFSILDMASAPRITSQGVIKSFCTYKGWSVRVNHRWKNCAVVYSEMDLYNSVLYGQDHARGRGPYIFELERS